MTTLPPRLVTLLLASFAGGGLVSCTSDSAPDGNIFLNKRAPRYGHGGTENPRYKYGATDAEEEARRGETQYLNDRKPREERSGDAFTQGGAAPTGGRSESEPVDAGATEAPPRKLEPIAETAPTEPAPKTKPAVTEDIPYATPVPGQDGKVYSPFSNGGYVDVSGMPSGSKARCPYTKKIFRVP